MTVVAEPLTCALPALPEPMNIVGRATPDGITLTKSDAAEIARYVMAQTAWIRAASVCIGGGK